MNIKTKALIALPVFLLTAWFSYSLYNYFFDMSPPTIEIVGIDEGGYYAGDVTCVVHGHDDYKVHDISVSLDNKVLVSHHKIQKKDFEYAFPVATKTIPNGKHTLKVELQDASYRANKTVVEVPFLVDNTALQAALVKGESEKVFQGRTLHVQFQVNKEIAYARVQALAQTFQCVPEAPNSLIYECFIPIKTDELPNEYLVSVELTDKVGNVLNLDSKFHVVMFPFKKQNLHVSKEKVAQESTMGQSQRLLNDALEEITRNSVPRKLWQGAFYVPCDMKGMSTDFGTVRVTQERGKYAHNAVDLLATPKSVIWAAQDGIIVHKERYAFSGNTIVIDHGIGVITLYYHLDNFADVEIGQVIKKGQPIGTLGMTGYASGYHLHWELRVNNVQVEPIQWTRHDF
jgi:hypothetical protein